MGDLYVVATPIGNLEDITFRAVRILKEVDLIATEDTRHAKILLDKYEIDTKKLVSFHAQSSDRKAEEILTKILEGKDVALISDAGTPCISDPGFKLTNICVQKNIKIIPIPGASAFLTLLSASGFPVDKFEFLGFLPHKKGRQTILKKIETREISSIFYESVHRFPKLLKELDLILEADRKICVGRELTKKFEEIFRGTIAEALEFYKKENIRGEFVVMIGGRGF